MVENSKKHYVTAALLPLLLLVTFFLNPTLGWAQKKIINPNPLSLDKAYIVPKSLPAGANAELIIDVHLAKEHHAYLDQFQLSLEAPKNLKFTQPEISPVVEFEDPVSDKIKRGIEGDAQLKSVIELPSDFPTGPTTATFQLRYQACTDDYCLFPKNIDVPVEFIALSPQAAFGEEAAAPTDTTTKEDLSLQARFEQALTDNWSLAFVLVFLAGILTSFTPCIFPMIPITLAIVGARSEEQSKLGGFILSLFYVLGIAFTYSILGLLAASTGALFGAFLGHPIVVAVIATIFVLMALSMFGLFELQAPAFIRDRLSSQKAHGGFLGAFLTGLMAGIVASPCVGPVLVSILTYVAKTQNLVLGFFLLFVFALGLGQLFLALGTFSHLIRRLPKAGPWMNSIKFIFGVTMVGLALYYVHPVVSERLFNGFLAAALILISSFFGAFEPNDKLTPALRLRKGLMLTAFVLGLALSVQVAFPGLLSSAHLNGSEPAGASKGEIEEQWKPYSKEALNAALEQGQPVIIDFYADWCVACKELEKFTFTHPEVVGLSDEFVLLRFDATESTRTFDELKEKYEIRGLPMVVFYGKNGQWRQDLTLTGFEKGPAFASRMKKALEVQ